MIDVPTGHGVVPVRVRIQIGDAPPGVPHPGVPYHGPGIPAAQLPPTAPRPWYQTPGAWVGAGAAAVVLVAGIAFAVSRSSPGIPPVCGCAVYSPSVISAPPPAGRPRSPPPARAPLRATA